MQVGRLKLHPLDLLIRMSPLAFCQCVFFGWTSGELDRVRIYGATEMTQHKAIALAINGAIAFGLNVVSFTANKKTSALTMTVAGEFPGWRAVELALQEKADPADARLSLLQPTSSKSSLSSSRCSSSTFRSTLPTSSVSPSPSLEELVRRLAASAFFLRAVTDSASHLAGYARVELMEKSRQSALNNAPTLLPTRPLDQEKL